MSLPEMLQYSQVKPKGFPTKFIRWEQFPQTTISQNFNKNEVVRFLFQTDKFIDPYQSYLEIEITQDLAPFQGDLKGASMPVLCLDGQATSLISEFRLYSNTKEIERIQEYDQLGCILHDINLQKGHKSQRGYEGMKYVQGGNYANFNNAPNYGYRNTSGFGEAWTQTHSFFNGQTPYSIPGWNISSAAFAKGAPAWISSGSSALSATSKALFYDSTFFGPAFAFGGSQPDNCDSIDQYKQQNIGDFVNYSPLSYTTAHYNYVRSILQYDSNYGIQDSIGSNYSLNYGDGQNNSPHVFGYTRPYSQGCDDDQVDMLIPGFEVLSLQNGKMKDTTVHRTTNPNLIDPAKTVTTKSYMIPILSGVIGSLIPQDQWRMIPGKAFGQMMLEFYLNPYAFFYSGLQTTEVTTNNDSLYLNSNHGRQWPMSWRITKFSIHFDLWSFDDAVHRTVDSLLAGEGIILSSTSWTLGPTYSISNTQSVINNWQINNGIPSVKMFFFWFLHNGYQKYNYLRKQYRVSQNITSIQLKIGQDYIPPTPIVGHAGNIARNSVIKADNTNFLMELHRNSNCFFNMAKTSKISAVEFAINQRWSYTNSYSIANQTPLWHETRMRGKALYTIDTSANPHDQSVFSGLDTTVKRPIELVLQADYNEPLTDSSTMYTMFFHDFIVVYRLDGVTTMGSG